ASRSVWPKISKAGRLATDRSCSARLRIAATGYANPNARAVDLRTTLRVALRAHSPRNNRPERNENCVTYVVGQICYLFCRVLKLTHLQRRCGAHRCDAVLHRVLHLREGVPLDLAHALARDAEFLGQFHERNLFLGEPACLEDAPLALVEHGERAGQRLAAV